MESLIYFLLWAGLFLVMMRFGCGAHVMGHGHGRKPAPPWKAKDIDPVCGMKVDPATAKASVYAGRTYYFCSPACRDKFEAEPAKYPESNFAAAADGGHAHAAHH